MALPDTNLAATAIRDEFSGPTSPININDYYKGGAYVSSSVIDPNTIPTSGVISYGDFRSAEQPIIVAYRGVVGTPAADSWVFTGETGNISGDTGLWQINGVGPLKFCFNTWTANRNNFVAVTPGATYRLTVRHRKSFDNGNTNDVFVNVQETTGPALANVTTASGSYVLQTADFVAPSNGLVQLAAASTADACNTTITWQCTRMDIDLV